MKRSSSTKRRGRNITPALRRTTRVAEVLAAPQIIEMVPLVLPLKRILVPVDFSKTSMKAMRYAVPVAKQCGAKLVLLHVVEYPGFAPELDYVGFDTESMRQRLKQQLREFARRTVPGEIQTDVQVECGVGFDIITAFAKKKRADLIVLTTHGYTGFKHILLGSTAERVVRHAPCPVLVVR